MRAVRLGCLVLGSVVAWPSSGFAGYEESPQVRRETRLAMVLVRRYCQPGYVMKALQSRSATSQWTWTASLLGDGRYRVNVEDFTWDVDVATKRIEPGGTVQAAVAKRKLPDVCLCVEGTPFPPADWAPASDGDESSVPVQTQRDGRTEPAVSTAPAPKAHSAVRVLPKDHGRTEPAVSTVSASAVPGWLIGTWKGEAKGATVRYRFSADGTWRRQRTEAGATSPSLTVEGTSAPAGTALRLKVTAVRVAPGARPGEKPPKVGSSVDATCYRSGDGGLIMLTSGAIFRASRAGD